MGADQPCLGDGCARGSGARGQPVGRYHRQPVGQDHRKRRPARLRCRISSPWRSIPPTSRTATAPSASSPPFAISARGCAISSPTAAMPATSSRARPPRRLDDRGHQAIRQRRGLRRAATPLGGGAHQPRPLPPAGQGLRGEYRQRRRLGPRRPHPPPHPPPGKGLKTCASF
jgi:hypothetical protein